MRGGGGDAPHSDRARRCRKAAQRHGGGRQPVDIDEIEIAAPVRDDELLAINEALEKFAALDAPKAEPINCASLPDWTLEQAAAVLGVSEPTAKRWWAYARAWLFEEFKLKSFSRK